MFTKKCLVSAVSGRIGKVRWRDVLEYFSFIFGFFVSIGSIKQVNLVSLLLNDMAFSGIFLLFLVPFFFLKILLLLTVDEVANAVEHGEVNK